DQPAPSATDKLLRARAALAPGDAMARSAVCALARFAESASSTHPTGFVARYLRRQRVAWHRAVLDEWDPPAFHSAAARSLDVRGAQCPHLRYARRQARRVVLQPGCGESTGCPRREVDVSPAVLRRPHVRAHAGR